MRTILKNLLPFTQYPYRGAIVKCPVCASEEFEPVSSLDRSMKLLPTVMCTRCGLLYTNPMPDEDELSHFYEKYYRLVYQRAVSKPTEKHRRNALAEAGWRGGNLEGVLHAGAKTLDFGCGSGEFVELMAAKGFDAHGFEPGVSYGSDAKARLGDRITISRWQNMKLEPEYDLVTSFHVIEHLGDPLKAIAAMASWIRPNGKIYIEVPDMGSAPIKGIGGFHFAHVVGFNHYNLRLAAANVGLVLSREFAPTRLLFERGETDGPEGLASKGVRLARQKHLETSALQSYFYYQLSKLRRKIGR